jgi:hypothetical protein
MHPKQAFIFCKKTDTLFVSDLQIHRLISMIEAINSAPYPDGVIVIAIFFRFFAVAILRIRISFRRSSSQWSSWPMVALWWNCCLAFCVYCDE